MMMDETERMDRYRAALRALGVRAEVTIDDDGQAGVCVGDHSRYVLATYLPTGALWLFSPGPLCDGTPDDDLSPETAAAVVSLAIEMVEADEDPSPQRPPLQSRLDALLYAAAVSARAARLEALR